MPTLFKPSKDEICKVKFVVFVRFDVELPAMRVLEKRFFTTTYNTCYVPVFLLGSQIVPGVNLFNYLRNIISYEGELEIDYKLNNFLKITGILNNVFRTQKTLKKTIIKLYNTLALPVLLCANETWTIKARDAGRITAAEMKCMRRTAG